MLIPKMGGTHAREEAMNELCSNLGISEIKGYYELFEGGFLLLSTPKHWFTTWVRGLKKGSLDLYVDCSVYPDWVDVSMEVDMTQDPLSQVCNTQENIVEPVDKSKKKGKAKTVKGKEKSTVQGQAKATVKGKDKVSAVNDEEEPSAVKGDQKEPSAVKDQEEAGEVKENEEQNVVTSDDAGGEAKVDEFYDPTYDFKEDMIKKKEVPIDDAGESDVGSDEEFERKRRSKGKNVVESSEDEQSVHEEEEKSMAEDDNDSDVDYTGEDNVNIETVDWTSGESDDSEAEGLMDSSKEIKKTHR